MKTMACIMAVLMLVGVAAPAMAQQTSGEDQIKGCFQKPTPRLQIDCLSKIIIRVDVDAIEFRDLSREKIAEILRRLDELERKLNEKADVSALNELRKQLNNLATELREKNAQQDTAIKQLGETVESQGKTLVKVQKQVKGAGGGSSVFVEVAGGANYSSKGGATAIASAQIGPVFLDDTLHLGVRLSLGWALLPEDSGNSGGLRLGGAFRATSWGDDDSNFLFFVGGVGLYGYNITVKNWDAEILNLAADLGIKIIIDSVSVFFEPSGFIGNSWQWRPTQVDNDLVGGAQLFVGYQF